VAESASMCDPMGLNLTRPTSTHGARAPARSAPMVWQERQNNAFCFGFRKHAHHRPVVPGPVVLGEVMHQENINSSLCLANATPGTRDAIGTPRTSPHVLASSPPCNGKSPS
ncbi:MAG: hypothetical protein ACREP9_15760, partial [Candidatus Dormibacteraceae bacterium]